MNNKIAYDKKSFIINNERVYINSASVHYFRMPREEWREVLLKAKLAGMNCIDTYFAWNIHEAEEQEWDFAGDKDCDAFLKLCAELGMWVIARPGPFICAEWDFGGFPYWLIKKEGIKFRQHNDEYLKYVDIYFDKIVPIIEQNQITRGGSVIMVQVENEYDNLVPEASVDKENYLNHLRDSLVARGIDVTLISCNGTVEGAVECINFWSGADKHAKILQEKQPNAPLFNTEFWTGWFENWGGNRATQKTPALLEKRIMEMIRAGYKGFNQYMFFGGTNFANFGGRTVNNSDIFMVTSYDYDAPLNEYCCITPKYYATKRLGYFVNTISNFLMESNEMVSNFKTSNMCSVRGREYNDEKMYFVESKGEEREKHAFTTSDGKCFEVTLNPGQIVPVVVDYTISKNIKMDYNSFFSLCKDLDGIDTLLVYGDNGQRSKLVLTFDEAVTYEDEQLIAYEMDNNNHRIQFDFCHYTNPQEISLAYGANAFRIIVLNTETMDKTWLVNSTEGKILVIGCEDLSLDGYNRVKFGVNKKNTRIKLYGAKDKDINLIFDCSSEDLKFNENQYPIELTFDCEEKEPNVPKLENWHKYDESIDTDMGLEKAIPIGFGEFGKDFGYLLYTAYLYSATERETTVVIPKIMDTARVYLNGEEIKLLRDVVSSSLQLNLRTGSNKLQFLIQAMGRYNYSHFVGEDKGLLDTVYFDGVTEDLRSGWSLENDEVIHLKEVHSIQDNSIITKEFYNDNYDRAILTGSISEELWVNGRKVDMGKYQQGWHFISVDISEYIKVGLNKIVMKYYRSSIERLDLNLFDSIKNVNNWKIESFAEYSEAWNWGLLDIENSSRIQGCPTWLKASFVKPVLQENKNLKLKLRMSGMGKGFILLNEIHIGRYWQIGPQEDYKLPMAWLKEENELILFDEEGRLPDKVKLMWEDTSIGNWM